MVQVGREAARMLLARIQDPDLPYQRVDLPARLSSVNRQEAPV